MRMITNCEGFEFLTKGLSWKRPDVCSLLQAAETKNLPVCYGALVSEFYPR